MTHGVCDIHGCEMYNVVCGWTTDCEGEMITKWAPCCDECFGEFEFLEEWQSQMEYCRYQEKAMPKIDEVPESQ